MALSFGFFDAINSDRVYSAEDMNAFLTLLTSDGVLATPQGTPSNYFQTIENSGMTVKVKPGIAVVNGHWMKDTADATLSIDSAHSTLMRIDSIVIRCDSTDRICEIAVVKGTPSASPAAPALTNTAYIKEYRLANIRVSAGATSIVNNNIIDTRGTADCPWITSLVQIPDTSTLFGAYNTALQNALDETTAGNLQNQINSINLQIAGIPNVSSGTADPSGGTDGDIYIKYEA